MACRRFGFHCRMHDRNDANFTSESSRVTNFTSESTRVTIADVLTLTLGFASFFAFSVLQSFGSPFFYGFEIPFWMLLYFIGLLIALLFTWALTFAIVRRVLIYNRMPRAAEWIAILMTMNCLSWQIPNVDTVINWRWAPWCEQSDFEVLRWALAIETFCAALILSLVATRMRPRYKVAVLCLAAIFYFWGICEVSEQQIPYLYSHVFTTFDVKGDSWWIWVTAATSYFFKSFPLLIVFAIPATVAIRHAKSSRFQGLIWTEWIALLCGAFLATAMLWAFVIGEVDGWDRTQVIISVTMILCLISLFWGCWVLAGRREKRISALYQLSN